MEGSRIEGLTLKDSRTVPVESEQQRSEAISVTGYDPSLPQEDLKSALSKHFASCGEITDILILDSRALIHMYGLGSVQRAVRLHGTDLGGGFNLTVQEASDSD
ncbi:hypothetical protein F2Q68_00000174 [Brassica cretica]|uniref:RRM domain-containing protein n=1 Tax=Brassica cretica TaxID=69181 RepID=A0A8S9J6J3_BRACR|nr:hypothetical protein F2Q68_00000174 [Brassica cretica]